MLHCGQELGAQNRTETQRWPLGIYACRDVRRFSSTRQGVRGSCCSRAEGRKALSAPHVQFLAPPPCAHRQLFVTS